MALEIFLRRQMGALRPFDALGEEAIASIGQGETVKCVITRPRNVIFHNKFFALLNVLFPHQSYYATATKFRRAVHIALGHCEETKLPSGKIMVEASSIAWHKMDESDFDSFMQRFFELAETRILPGINRADVEREWEEVMAGYKDKYLMSSGAVSSSGKGAPPAGAGELAGGTLGPTTDGSKNQPESEDISEAVIDILNREEDE